MGQPNFTLPSHLTHVGVGWVVRWPGAAFPGHLFASTLEYVYMRAALAVLGTATRARPHLPATPGLGSDTCLSLIFKSHPSLWYPAEGSTLASIWLGVGAYCALGGGYSGPSSTVLGPREVAKPTPVSLARTLLVLPCCHGPHPPKPDFLPDLSLCTQTQECLGLYKLDLGAWPPHALC